MREHLKIFISYSKVDYQKVRLIYNRLVKEGFRPWIDELELLPGQDWKHEIYKNLNTSDVVLVFLSNAAINKAGFLNKEIKESIDIAGYQPEGRIFLIPIKIEECEIPIRLRLWQWLEIYQEQGFYKLIKALDFRASKLETLQVNENSIVDLGSGSYDIEGEYFVNGKNERGNYYEGKATIVNEKEFLKITWLISDEVYSGKGENKDGVFKVFGDSFVVSYIIGDDGTLSGIWGESGTERLTPRNYFPNLEF